MDQHDLIKLAVNYGLGIVLSIMMAVFMGWMLRYVLAQNAVREAKLASIIETHLASLDTRLTEHDARSAGAIRSIEEANRFQREEHHAMMNSLKSINETMIHVGLEVSARNRKS